MNGKSQIYLQVIINGRRKMIDLNLYWPFDKFEIETGECLERTETDEEYKEYNRIIKSGIDKVNEIFNEARFAGQSLTIEAFVKSYQDQMSRVSFLHYMEQKIEARYKEKEISRYTRSSHACTLSALKKFKKEILFNSIGQNFCIDFDVFIRKHKPVDKTKRIPTPLSLTTIWLMHKNVKKYFLLALNEDKIEFENPYEHFAARETDETRVFISPEGVKMLDEHYKKLKPGSLDRQILQQFLFGYTTGVQWADHSRIIPEWVHGDLLVIPPNKRKKTEDLLSITLSQRAIDLIEDAKRENNCKTLFSYYDGWLHRAQLKRICEKIGLKNKLAPNSVVSDVSS